jgi:sugar-phosphatase
MTFEFEALLFDLDGTLIASIAAVDRAWSAWSRRNGLDPESVLPRIHGRRSIDSIRVLVPHLDAESENDWVRNWETSDTEGIVPLAGAHEFLSALTCPWAIVTSGTTAVALARMRAAGLPKPMAAVYAEDVLAGKPAPDPFLLAAKRLGVRPERCVAFEDAVSGIRSARAAGMRVVGVASALSPAELREADAVISDYTAVSIENGRRLWVESQLEKATEA